MIAPSSPRKMVAIIFFTAVATLVLTAAVVIFVLVLVSVSPLNPSPNKEEGVLTFQNCLRHKFPPPAADPTPKDQGYLRRLTCFLMSRNRNISVIYFRHDKPYATYQAAVTNLSQVFNQDIFSVNYFLLREFHTPLRGFRHPLVEFRNSMNQLNRSEEIVKEMEAAKKDFEGGLQKIRAEFGHTPDGELHMAHFMQIVHNNRDERIEQIKKDYNLPETQSKSNKK